MKQIKKQQITEEMKLQEEWYKEANKMTLVKLPAFLKKLTENYQHDYGTICHAIAAAALAAAYAVDRTPTGGITGFQASAIMWQFIVEWGLDYKGKPLKLVDYSQMLYPQYDHKFEKTISNDTWDYLQKEAKKSLEETKDPHPDVKKHWESIISGEIPFGFTVSDN